MYSVTLSHLSYIPPFLSHIDEVVSYITLFSNVFRDLIHPTTLISPHGAMLKHFIAPITEKCLLKTNTHIPPYSSITALNHMYTL